MAVTIKGISVEGDEDKLELRGISAEGDPETAISFGVAVEGLISSGYAQIIIKK